MVRFLADANVGRLGRWLRALGYDADYEPRLPDSALVARALAEGRVLLTRDAELMRRRAVASGEVRALLLRDDDLGGQLRQVVRELDLSVDLALTRCLECNLELVPRSAEEVADRLPPRVRERQRRFTQCPGCGRVYWPGTHWERMRRHLGAMAP
ncbi:MAG TPA: Mut7-C RNAse domain-containing protein [Candidatus Dormibacteraeota bacterium]|nr:Mut7-C RNAse domain-containing protein [Candidatus Dormibacteraeota bacterium]